MHAHSPVHQSGITIKPWIGLNFLINPLVSFTLKIGSYPRRDKRSGRNLINGLVSWAVTHWSILHSVKANCAFKFALKSPCQTTAKETLNHNLCLLWRRSLSSTVAKQQQVHFKEKNKDFCQEQSFAGLMRLQHDCDAKLLWLCSSYEMKQSCQTCFIHSFNMQLNCCLDFVHWHCLEQMKPHVHEPQWINTVVWLDSCEFLSKM